MPTVSIIWYTLTLHNYINNWIVLGKELYDLFYEDKLISYKTIEENGEAMWNYAHVTITKSSTILLPLFCGLLMTVFTWIMIYLDSSVPGVKPPTPFSPEKYKLV